MSYSCFTNLTDGSSCANPFFGEPRIYPRILSQSDGLLTILSTLGVGLHKAITVTVVDDPYDNLIGHFSQTSAPLYFDYAPPIVTSLTNTLVLMTEGGAGATAYAELQVRALAPMLGRTIMPNITYCRSPRYDIPGVQLWFSFDRTCSIILHAQ